MRDRLSRWLPILDWGRHYHPPDLVADLTAGLIVAGLLIPQAMAYALLAGLPPKIGLYSAIAAPLIYALFGTSRALSVGPVALDSILLAAGLSVIVAPDSADYISLAITAALLVGAIQILMGVLRLGLLVNFVSSSVMAGFTSAASVTIALSQVRHLLGIKFGSTDGFFSLLVATLGHVGQTQGVTLAMSLGAIALLWAGNQPFARWLQKRGVSEIAALPLTKGVPLGVMVVGTVLVAALRLDQQGVAVVGSIPAGPPHWTMPLITGDRLLTLLPLALTLAFISFIESFSTGQVLARQRQQTIEADQELIAVGLANVGTAFAGGYCVAGGLSRSVVNFAAGARTGLASIITAGVILLTALFLTPLFFYVPQACLAAMICMAVIKLIDLKTLLKLWRYNPRDAWAFIVTFAGVLFVGIESGILVGIGFAIILYLWRTSHPHIAIVGRLGETEQFRNIKRHAVLTCAEVLAIRIDESLYFANTKVLETSLLNAIATSPKIEKLLLVCSGINFIDGSALDTLERLIQTLENLGVTLYLSDVKGPVMDGLERIGFIDRLGRDRLFLSAAAAMASFDCQLSANSGEERG
ncbi:sulfate permease [Spirulina sp. CCNP1310]|uniref:SulP family inorganic anion transporter n=1 Tax=Spirulina sp. CCNP1310 TaxID=3110249 RepID=UPI002B1F2A6E|nr:sulfate permease [Spirulina sp. CCNP1310]MEA5419285.1 sulfate permease [Spirulina sp. CCNP1310]